jgi:predicted glycogen debranching enzyme
VPLFLHHAGYEAAPSAGWYYRFENRIEKERGLDPVDDLYAPVELSCLLDGGARIVFTASTEERPRLGVFEDSGDWSLEERLEHSARHFLVETTERASIIAGYPWFTDWGRDTMIALPGICLETGEIGHAKRILRSYASQMREGLLPNRFVDGGEEPDSNTVDATLWFAWAIHQTLLAELDLELAEEAAGWLEEVYRWHVEGTKFGIRVDPQDGLLTQGGDGLQLTWMDAKIGEWVVTPRTGKPVEICALWVNLLRTLEWLCGELGRDGLVYRLAADKAESNFDEVFWRDSLGHYMDVAQPDDGSLRPNMVLALALPFSPANGPRALRSLDSARKLLLTPRGLRTLAPGEMGFRSRWEGDMKSRDSAYHQGTVWPWLLGFYFLACQRLGSDPGFARESLDAMTLECGLGGISEVYDATDPQRPGGCPWQAWSVAAALMALRAAK